MSAEPNFNEALDFLKLVTPPDAHMNVVAIHPTTENLIKAFAYTQSTISETIPFIQRHVQWNQYWSVNPLKGPLNKKATKGDVLGMRAAHLDRDDPSEEALAVIRAMSPTIIVFSGGGYQAFWN